MSEVNLTRKFLKERLQRDYSTFRRCTEQWSSIYDLLKRVTEIDESNSALLIGPRGSGKTTLISSVLHQIISTEREFLKNASVVCLNGLIHTDDRLALKSATIQLNLENVVDGKVFGSFAENLAFLLESLKTGDKQSKSIIFILEEFDLFCSHHNQTLLYNLFDVSQSAGTPVCVLGITCRLDVIELLEKRVKSRFSHRQIFLFSQNDNFEDYIHLFGDLLKLPTQQRDDGLKLNFNDSESNSIPIIEFYCLRNVFDKSKYKFSKEYVKSWNRRIDELIQENSVRKIIQNLYDFDTNEGFLKTFLFKLISKLNESTEYIKSDDVLDVYKDYETDDKILLLCELSVLELCLIITIKHHSEIFNGDPFNFEIIYNRFTKFAKTSTTLQGIERAIILKAFEHLHNLEFIQPINENTSSKYQKEFHMYKLLLTNNQIDKCISKYEALPTEIAQWALSSL